MLRFVFAVLVPLTAFGTTADRYSVVGVIAGTQKGNNVVVIWDEKEQKTFTLPQGGNLAPDAVVTKVERGDVEISISGKQTRLGYRNSPRPPTFEDVINDNLDEQDVEYLFSKHKQVDSEKDKAQKEALISILDSDQVSEYFPSVQEERDVQNIQLPDPVEAR